MQNIVMTTHRESIMTRYFLLTAMNKSMQTTAETNF